MLVSVHSPVTNVQMAKNECGTWLFVQNLASQDLEPGMGPVWFPLYPNPWNPDRIFGKMNRYLIYFQSMSQEPPFQSKNNQYGKRRFTEKHLKNGIKSRLRANQDPLVSTPNGILI